MKMFTGMLEEVSSAFSMATAPLTLSYRRVGLVDWMDLLETGVKLNC